MNKFEEYISAYLDSFEKNTISEAMHYSMEGGKRFRPRLIFSLLNGMGIPEEKGYPAALALELIQTYSLIHDDLPAMDNDDLRRGKPTLHKAFGEDMAILAGDALLTHAFEVLASAPYDAETIVPMVRALSVYSGMKGMIKGQLLDLSSDPKTLTEERLYDIQVNKTGGLFKIACLFAMYINKENDAPFYEGLGERIGIIFQNQDDLFDIIKSEEEMGKSLSDLKNEKPSAIALYSKEELEAIIDAQFRELEDYLAYASFDTKYVKELLYSIKTR